MRESEKEPSMHQTGEDVDCFPRCWICFGVKEAALVDAFEEGIVIGVCGGELVVGKDDHECIFDRGGLEGFIKTC